MSASNRTPHLDTTGRIARKLGVPIYRVQYIIATRGIEPSAYAGRLRLFNLNALARIRYELNKIDARRQGVIRGR